jgi:tellurite resistance protein TerC
MLRHKDDVIDPNNNLLVRIVKKIFPIKDDYEENHFFTRHNGKLHATTLFVALIVVEFSDLVFAIDSIPAIFAVSLDPFILYTSNTLAIIGLRSLYFALASVINRFYYLNHGLCALLVFVGCKMILSDVIHVPALLSLAVIVSILAVACIASIIKVKR